MNVTQSKIGVAVIDDQQLLCQSLAMLIRSVDNFELLAISVRTVEGHRNNLLTKTGCQTTAGLVIYAIKNKLVAV